jgi:succinate-semialdehyde dehydrogenase / glutarate-semialdehyde dehydrogenase
LKVGPATDTGSQIGPMINVRAIEKIEQHIRNAQSLGAQIALGGQRLQGNYFSPIILVNVSASMQCSCEETFGPVVPITRFHTEQEVLAAANATPFGLAAYFYSQNPARIWRVSEALETGIVGVNEGAISAQVAPFGGVKESGYGREGSVHGLDDYQNIKYVCQGGLT